MNVSWGVFIGLMSRMTFAKLKLMGGGTQTKFDWTWLQRKVEKDEGEKIHYESQMQNLEEIKIERLSRLQRILLQLW